MKRKIITILLFTPLYLFFIMHGMKILRREVSDWLKIIPLPDTHNIYFNSIELLSRLPEFRSLLYYRYKINEFNPVRAIYPGEHISINCRNVGEGLVIQHGFGTRIGCEKMGKNCQVWQGVTLGKTRSGLDQPRPIIGDNVKICANAMVLGGITVGDNAIIGAAAVVLKDVPANATVAGNPARIIKQR